MKRKFGGTTEGITSLSRKVARRTTDQYYAFLPGRDVVCRHCGTDRIYSEQCEKLYPERKAKFKKFVSRNKPYETIGLHTRTPQRKRGPPTGTRVNAGSFPGRCYGWLQPGGGKSRTTDRETADAGFQLIRQRKRTPVLSTWSIAACLAIGFGVSSYFLFLKKSMTDEVFIAKESVSSKLAELAIPPTPAIPATPTVPATPQKEIALATAKVKTDPLLLPKIPLLFPKLLRDKRIRKI